MNDERLKELLRQADADVKLGSFDTRALGDGVQRRLYRRKQIRYYSIAAAAVIMIVCMLSVQHDRSSRRREQVALLQADLQRLKAECEQTQTILQEMLANQKQQDAAIKQRYQIVSQGDVMDRQLDETAFILVYQADRLIEKYGNRDVAAEYYRRVIDCFGQTPSAQTARQRLINIDSENQHNSI